ncbi:tyrosine-type recombinase/integrase [Streptomyces sp. NPDC000410]|uniref:tyrosine-type recombinase/integrase n=1 Tax=Streptomyces sp. NPDC000410 TaxID=3154254 RepID=UPI003321D069
MTVGEHVQRRAGLDKRGGKPLSPRTKAGYLTATRTFFRDCQEWEWIPRRFDPVRALATPRSVAALIGPNPRVIADDIWAKLLWAGLNVDPEDFPTNTYGLCYPIELIRAITLAWLFGGLRSDEISRLRTGCIRWQHDGFPIPGDSDEVLARDAVCLLDVPTHKTGTSFTKPIDPLLGKAIEAWQDARPQQPKMLDRKTGEQVDFLFAHRAKRLAITYINTAVIPSLCRKAGVPTADVRGNITSHRARSTIGSQLYNAKEPMTLFELQAWLGHRSPEATQRYAKITPNTLPSTTVRPRSTSCWNGWWISPRQLGRHPERLAFRRRRRSCRSPPSTSAKDELLDKSDSAECRLLGARIGGGRALPDQ